MHDARDSDDPMDAIRFATRYDVARLREDLAAAVAATSWTLKPERGKYLRWASIALHRQYRAKGEEVRDDPEDVHVPAEFASECGPTAALRACAYVGEILASFAAAKLRVRFMRLAAGGRIGRHSDRQYGWELPILRFHVPVVTDADVEFLLAGRRVEMRPGELWYLDTTREHEVINHGANDRVHLVIDLVNGAGLRASLGPETWAAAISRIVDRAG